MYSIDSTKVSYEDPIILAGPPRCGRLRRAFRTGGVHEDQVREGRGARAGREELPRPRGEEVVRSSFLSSPLLALRESSLGFVTWPRIPERRHDRFTDFAVAPSRSADRDDAAVIGAVILAAGEASRFGSPKQRLMLAGILERVRASSVEEIVVGRGCLRARHGRPRDALCGVGRRTGRLAALRPRRAGRRGGGGDRRPRRRPRPRSCRHRPCHRRLARRHRRRSPRPTAASAGHPVLLARAVWADVPDEGARALEPTLVPCDDLGAPGDVDYPDDFRRPTP